VPYYKFSDKAMLLIEPTSRALFYAALVVLLINRFMWPYVLVCFGLRLCVQLITLILVGKKLNEKRIIVASLFFDIFSPIINFVFYICKPSKKTGVAKWK
jgi:hypothetical protein